MSLARFSCELGEFRLRHFVVAELQVPRLRQRLRELQSHREKRERVQAGVEVVLVLLKAELVLLLRLGEVARLQRRLRRLFRDRHPFVLPPRLGVATQKRLRLGALGGR